MNNKAMETQFNALEDNELFSVYQEGNLLAEEVLIKRYFPLISSRVTALMGGFVPADHQEAVGEGMIGLLKAVRNYQPSKGVGFKTFAYTCVSNQILNFRSGKTRQACREELGGVSLEEEHCYCPELDPQQIVSHREWEDTLRRLLQTLLTQLEYDILLLFCSGLSYKEVADRLSISTKTVDNAMVRCRRKLGNLSSCL